MDQDQVAHLLELEDKLSHIRSQINSKLNNQKHIAIILTAVEENIDEQQATNKNIVNYLISFMSLLDQATNPETHEIIELQLATSATYLLDILFKYTPKALLRSKFAEMLTKIAPCITDEKSQAPLIKSAVGCLESLLIAQDSQSWNNTQNLSITPTRGLSGLLELSLDPRPKVRKRAQDAISNILSNPPPSPTAEHVAAPIVAEFTINALASAMDEASSVSNKKLKAQGGSNEFNTKIIHILKLVSKILSTKQWPSSRIDALCDVLLEISKSSDEFLVSSSFQCFESLFQSIAESTASSGLVENKFLKVLDVIFSLKPSNNDMNLANTWISVVGKGMSTYAKYQPLTCFMKLPDVFNIMGFYLASETPEVYKSASKCLNTILNDTVQEDLLLYPPAVDEKTFETVDNVISSLADVFVEFLSIKYVHCAKEILAVLTTGFNKFTLRCNPDFLKPLAIVGEWRTNEDNFLDFKIESEIAIGAAISAIGPDTVTSILPMNLKSNSPSQPGRAWLIPLVRDFTKHSKLAIFVNQFLPLISFFESKIEGMEKESVQAKVFQTVIDQVWSTLPSFCELPEDLRTSFTDEFAAELSSLLYSNVGLRPTICRAFKNLVESNSSYVSGSIETHLLLQQQFPRVEADENLVYLSSKASNLLAVLFNVYTQTAPNARGYILETIESILKITIAEDLEKTFNNVCALLKGAFEEEANGREVKNGGVRMSATLLDIVVAMTKYVPVQCYGALFALFNTTVNSTDALTQKRSYRIITKLSELEKGSEAIQNYIANIEDVMIQSANTVQTSSKAARLQALKTLIDMIPVDHLGFIVQVVPEVILATKDVNEKTRESAFETLIKMTQRMSDPNGVIILCQIPGYDPTIPNQTSSISEFFKIISAGLIGESQHMVSATITAYSCLVFEFRDQVSTEVLLDIYDTIELYLTSNSREIVKSAIGFAKVCCLGLPEEMIKPKIPAILPKLLRWSHEHTGHFKAKVKHIIERLIRRFGYDFIDQNFPEEDKRLLANIRKTRNRNKRKGTDEVNLPEVNSADTAKKGSRFMSALDEVLYESSEEDASDEEGNPNQRRSKKFIVESKENPLDLLDAQTLSHISSTRPKKFDKGSRRTVKDDVVSFDAEGRMVVDNEDGKTEEQNDPLKAITSGINAYLEAVEHGPIRGQKNRLKFKKGNRAGNDETFSDDEAESKLVKKIEGKNRKSVKKGGKFKSRKKL